jgi:hypothetical protein
VRSLEKFSEVDQIKKPAGAKRALSFLRMERHGLWVRASTEALDSHYPTPSGFHSSPTPKCINGAVEAHLWGPFQPARRRLSHCGAIFAMPAATQVAGACAANSKEGGQNRKSVRSGGGLSSNLQKAAITRNYPSKEVASVSTRQRRLSCAREARAASLKKRRAGQRRRPVRRFFRLPRRPTLLNFE